MKTAATLEMKLLPVTMNKRECQGAEQKKKKKIDDNLLCIITKRVSHSTTGTVMTGSFIVGKATRRGLSLALLAREYKNGIP